MNRVVTAVLTLASIIMPTGVHTPCQPLAQRRCNLSEADSPTIRGIRLGMSTDELLALFPGSSKRKEIKDVLERAKSPTGETLYIGFEAAEGSKERFGGVDSVSAGLYKGRVADFTVTYSGTWATIDEWVSKLSETLGLPGTQEWVVGPSENPNKALKCSGIEIEAALQGGSASLRIRSTLTEQRPNPSEDKKKRDFKP